MIFSGQRERDRKQGSWWGGEGGDKGRSEWSLGGRFSASYCRRYLGCTWGVSHVVTAGVYSSGKWRGCCYQHCVRNSWNFFDVGCGGSVEMNILVLDRRRCMCTKRRSTKEATQKGTCWCCDSNTRPHQKRQKARTDSVSVFRKPQLEKFYFVL